MADVCHIYLFGDQTYDSSKELRTLLHSTSDPLLISFFEKTFYALRLEIGNLPFHKQQEFPRIANFSEIVALSLTGPVHPALDQALCCAYQLAAFIR
jgi:naphtho-gamma-pyrone polyketide synthase